MKHIEIKNIPYFANVLVATRDPHISMVIQPKNVREQFRVEQNNQTLYFDYEDDDDVLIRIRCTYWKQVEVETFLLASNTLNTIIMKRDERTVNVDQNTGQIDIRYNVPLDVVEELELEIQRNLCTFITI